MRRQYAIPALAVGLLLCATSRTATASVDFGNNPINFSAPQVFIGDAQVTSAAPTLVPTASGFQVQDLSYTLTAGPLADAVPISVSWSATRAFTGTPTTADVSGHTVVTTSGFGPDTSVSFGVDPSILSHDPVTGANVVSIFVGYHTTLTGDGTFPLSWDKTVAVLGRIYDSPVLKETGSITWRNAVPGATISLASDYGTTIFAAPVPEPASAWLLAAGALGLLGYRARRRARAAA